MLLTPEQVKDLTGLEKPSAQSKWLKRQGITHFINAQNVVKVTWNAVDNPAKKESGGPRFENVA